ncbi:MAG: TetR/AcrR family transcriptional regulator [Thermodesulfobacteriota bacterium]|nr:TetR/AcrR family transcriptional regulator [Thermodesulfobacteriota bacterium]
MRDENNYPEACEKSPAVRKSDVTREKILAAARKVFSGHPYKAATMRMIAAEGGFDHPLIRYYFPAKADLFKAVVQEACEAFYTAHVSWFEGLDKLPPEEGLRLFIDRFLDYHFSDPAPMKILAINSVVQDDPIQIPGYDYVPDVLARVRRNFERLVSLRASADEISAFISSFNNLVVIYLGADTCQARIMNMAPESDEYRQWVKNTLLYIFAPLLKKLIFPEKAPGKAGGGSGG